MSKQIVGKLLAFKGDYDYADHNTFVEVTNFQNDGTIELAFNAEFPGKPRIYIAVNLPQLLAVAMGEYGMKP